MQNLSTRMKVLLSIAVVAVLAGIGYVFLSHKSGSQETAQFQVTSSDSANGSQSGTVTVSAEDAVAFVSKAEGKVTRKTGAGENPVASGNALGLGDTLVTGADSRAEIVFADSSVVRLAANSVLSLTVVTSENTQVELSSGELWARILKPLTDDSFFSVKTSDLSAGVRGTSLRVRKAGKKTHVEVVDSAAKSAETPGVDIAYQDASGNQSKEHLLPEEGFSLDTLKNAKEKKKLAMQEIMKEDFVRENTIEDLAYMDALRKAAAAGKKPVEVLVPGAPQAFLSKFDASKIKSYQDRVNKELTVSVPKKEEIPFFFNEPSVRDRALQVAQTTGGGGGAFIDGILKEAGHEATVIETSHEIDQVRHEIEGQAADPTKQAEIKKRIEELRKQLKDTVEQWKNEPATGSGTEAPEAGTGTQAAPSASTNPTNPTVSTKSVTPAPAPTTSPAPTKPAVSSTPIVKPSVSPTVSGTPIPR